MKNPSAIQLILGRRGTLEPKDPVSLLQLPIPDASGKAQTCQAWSTSASDPEC